MIYQPTYLTTLIAPCSQPCGYRFTRNLVSEVDLKEVLEEPTRQVLSKSHARLSVAVSDLRKETAGTGEKYNSSTPRSGRDFKFTLFDRHLVPFS